MEMIGGYTLVERLEMTIKNIKFQKGKVFWDDLEKLELILEALKKKEFVDGFLRLYGEDGICADEVATPWTENKIKVLYGLCKKDKELELIFEAIKNKEVA